MDIYYLFTTITIPIVRTTTTTSSMSITGTSTPIRTALLLSSLSSLPPVLAAGLLAGISIDEHGRLLAILLSVALTNFTVLQGSCPLGTPHR